MRKQQLQIWAPFEHSLLSGFGNITAKLPNTLYMELMVMKTIDCGTERKRELQVDKITLHIRVTKIKLHQSKELKGLYKRTKRISFSLTYQAYTSICAYTRMYRDSFILHLLRLWNINTSQQFTETKNLVFNMRCRHILILTFARTLTLTDCLTAPIL